MNENITPEDAETVALKNKQREDELLKTAFKQAEKKADEVLKSDRPQDALTAAEKTISNIIHPPKPSETEVNTTANKRTKISNFTPTSTSILKARTSNVK